MTRTHAWESAEGEDEETSAWCVVAFCLDLRNEPDCPPPLTGAFYETSAQWLSHRRTLQLRLDNWKADGIAPEYDDALRALVVATLNLEAPPWIAAALARKERVFAGGAELIRTTMPATPAQPTGQEGVGLWES